MCQGHDRIGRRTAMGNPLLLMLFATLLTVFSVEPALANKVTIFAWVEGDTVFTQSKFSGGKRVKNCTVAVFDDEGNALLEGETDDNGEFSFKIPKKTGLRVVLKASMGHLAEWTIPVEEITGVEETSETVTPQAEPAESRTKPLAEEGMGTQVPTVTGVGLSREELKTLIDQSLDRKLTPVVNMLADAMDPGPTMKDVIGGLGYIFGLVGVGLYFSNRRKSK